MEEKLKKWFGFESFRKGQKEPISSVLNGNHTVAILPTGTGKSLIYQYCGYSIEGLVVIVSPLLSLMDNQVTQLKASGEKRTAALNSMLSREERAYVEANLDRYKFLFVSPEMLQSDRLLRKLAKLPLALFVVDEAHCISQWGLDFRPDYLFLGKVRTFLGNPLTLALTATAPEKVIADILNVLDLKRSDTDIHRYDPNRSNIFYHIEETIRADKDACLLGFLKSLPSPGIIYFTSKAQAEKVNQMIKERTSLRVDTYHADRTKEDRTTIQRQFLSDKLDVICATSAFGMGINKQNVRFVIHYHMPGSIEEYLQEAGRAGRDGLQSIAILLYDPSDVAFKYRKAQETDLNGSFLQNRHLMESGLLSDSDLAMIQIIAFQKMTPDQAQAFVEERIQDRLRKVREMNDYAKTEMCKRATLSAHFNHELENRPLWCCSNCQTNMEELLLNLSKMVPTHAFDRKKANNWKEIVKELFLL